MSSIGNYFIKKKLSLEILIYCIAYKCVVKSIIIYIQYFIAVKLRRVNFSIKFTSEQHFEMN